MSRVMLLAPAMALADCVGDSCLARDSVLLQASKAAVQKHSSPHDEGGLAAARTGLTQESVGLTEEGLVAFKEMVVRASEEEQQSAEHEDEAEEYVICMATGKTTTFCQDWSASCKLEGAICPPAGAIPGWNGTHFCQEKRGSDANCMTKCKDDFASCAEGGEHYEFCRCEDLTPKTVAACDSKAASDACSFSSEVFATTEGETMWSYRSICHDHDGDLTCAPIRRLWCHTGNHLQGTLQWKPIGAPCIHATATTSSGWKEETPTLSYCVPRGEKSICTTGYNTGVPAEIKGALSNLNVSTAERQEIRVFKNFWKGK